MKSTKCGEWIQKCSFVAGGEIEQMDAKVLLMLVVITGLPRASPGHPGRVWVGDGARARWTPFRASRGDAVVPERAHFRPLGCLPVSEFTISLISTAL